LPPMDERRRMDRGHAPVRRAQGWDRGDLRGYGRPPQEGRNPETGVSARFSLRQGGLGLKRSIPAYLAMVVIRLYQRFLSPFLGKNCRFVPTCSAYTFEAIERYGFMEGILLGVKRIIRCGPWSPGGFDPVPDLRREAGSGKIRKNEPKGR